MLTPETISKLKSKLLEEKSRLEKDLPGLKKVDFGNDTDHGEEEAEEDEQIEINAGITGDLAARLDDIETALRKIEHNKYGRCEKCGKEIELELLEVNPESQTCRADKR
jgi:RNA polymerase-binding transcription factor DksA